MMEAFVCLQSLIIVINIISNFYYPAYTCMAKPPSLSNSSITIMMEINFAYSLDPETSITFLELPQNNVTFNSWSSPSSNVNGVFFDYYQPSNNISSIEEGGLVYLEIYGSFAYFTFAPDDWSLNFAAIMPSNYYGPVLFSAPTTGHGWYVLAQIQDPPLSYRISSIDATHLTIPLSSTSISATLTLFQLNNTFVGLVRVSVPNLSSAVHVTFSTPCAYTIAQANSIPPTYDQDVFYTYSPPPDLVGYATFEVTDADSITIPAAAFQTGAFSQDFYAVVYLNATDVEDSDVEVTAFVIHETVVNSAGSSPITITVNASSVPQVFRIPYTEHLLVVSTELSFSPPTNTTSYAMFGAGGYQVIPLDETHFMSGLHVSPLVDYFYASNFTYDYYFLVFANSPDVTLTVVPSNIYHLCNPVLLCNGHGVCHSDRISDSCVCVQGESYFYLLFIQQLY